MKNATKRLLAFVLAAAMMLSLAPVGARAAANENLALGRPATCSNVEANTSFTADKAVDGSLSTRWATDMNVSDPWIVIDHSGLSGRGRGRWCLHHHLHLRRHQSQAA